MFDKELHSRLVFIDTSAYESKNFQFGQHSLKKIEDFLNLGKLHLLITDVTIKEIKERLREKSYKAASSIKKFQKEGMFLRNTPNLPCYGIFEKVRGNDIMNIVNSKFDALLKNNNIEIVTVKNVDTEKIFQMYFEKRPPFGKAKKKTEFPDAFALEAVKKTSEERGQGLYIISNDPDMKEYASANENIVHLDSMDNLINLVVRNTEELKEPATFADSIFDQLQEKIIVELKEILSDTEFSFEEINAYDDELYDIEINLIEILDKNIIEVTTESAEYEIEFKIDLTAHYCITDYDNSPWDPEDKDYIFFIHNEIVKRHHEIFSGYITLTYFDGIRANAEIAELDLNDNIFKLRDRNSEIIEFRESHTNGG